MECPPFPPDGYATTEFVQRTSLAVTVPSPLEGEGMQICQRIHWGEGVASQKELLTKKPPHPALLAASVFSPLPQGERAQQSAPPTRHLPLVIILRAPSQGPAAA